MLPGVNGKTARRIENTNHPIAIPNQTANRWSESNSNSQITHPARAMNLPLSKTNGNRMERLVPEPTSFPGPAGLRGKRRSFMDQKSNYITIEMNLRLQMKDYRLVLGMKRTWIVALVVGAIQLLAWALKGHHL